MEAERKRKRPAGGWEDKRSTRGEGGDLLVAGAEEAAAVVPPVNCDVEEEVEKFFAIVRRMHAATRQFAGCGERMTEAASGRQIVRRERAEWRGIYRWRPAFEWEDFEEGRGHKVPDAGGCCTLGEVGSATSAPLAALGLGAEREDKAAANGTAVMFLDLNTEPEPERVVDSWGKAAD